MEAQKKPWGLQRDNQEKLCGKGQLPPSRPGMLLERGSFKSTLDHSTETDPLQSIDLQNFEAGISIFLNPVAPKEIIIKCIPVFPIQPGASQPQKQRKTLEQDSLSLYQAQK